MGQWKDLQQSLDGGNPKILLDKYVCSACITDDGLRGFIEDGAYAKTCTFCGAESTDPIAASLVDVVIHIKECLEREYDFAENKLPYESAEGGYIGQAWMTIDILESHLGDALPHDDGILLETLCDGLGEHAWCRKRPFSLSEHETLNFSWDEFCELIKYRRRYFFLRERAHQELLSPLALLNELESWCKRFGLVKTLPANHLFYRVRLQKPDEKLETAAQLGPPPENKATQANRMSPPGIVMFYASDKAETALREVAKDSTKDVGLYAIGKFRTLRDVRILDLTEIPPIPSIFEPIPDSLEYEPRTPLIFINYFATEISKPIAGDRSIHIEYIPSQVVTEYFRTAFTHDSQPIAGIRYQSARQSSGRSLVLFANQDNIVDANPSRVKAPFPENERWIELVGREERDITADDLDQWNREAPLLLDLV